MKYTDEEVRALVDAVVDVVNIVEMTRSLGREPNSVEAIMIKALKPFREKP